MSSVIAGAEEWSSPGTGRLAEVGVLVVHGFTGNPISTRPLGESIAAEGYKVSVPRLPGHGTTVAEMRRTGYPDWLDAVEREHDRLAQECRAVVLVGFSMGGTLVLDVASRREVAGIVTINGLSALPPNPLLPLMPLLQHVVRTLPPKLAGIAEDDIKRPGVSEQAYDRIPLTSVYSLARAVPRVRAALPQLVAPILVVNSAEDHTVDPGNATVIADEVGSDDVRRLVLQDSYHVATLDHDRELLEAAVRSFVADVTAG